MVLTTYRPVAKSEAVLLQVTAFNCAGEQEAVED